MPYKERLEIRLTEEERKLIEEAAWKQRMKISEWARKTLKEAAEFYGEKT